MQTVGLAESRFLQKAAHEGQGGRRENPRPCAGGAGAFGHPGEKVPNASLSAFPPQGEKGAAGPPGPLGLLGHKVGIDEL